MITRTSITSNARRQSGFTYAELKKKIAMGNYREATKHNYKKLKNIVAQYDIQLVCVQYPMRKLWHLRKILTPSRDIIFVDTEEVFKEAIARDSR